MLERDADIMRELPGAYVAQGAHATELASIVLKRSPYNGTTLTRAEVSATCVALEELMAHTMRALI